MTVKQFNSLVAKQSNISGSDHGQHEKEKKEEVLVLRLPLPKGRGNRTGSGMKDWREKMDWQDQCQDDLGIFLRRYRHVRLPLQAIEWEMHCEVEKYNDYDNLVNRIKWALDLLTENGILVDDNWFRARQKRGSEPTQVLQPKRSLPRFMYLRIYPCEPWIELPEQQTSDLFPEFFPEPSVA